jgi:hypothetical protein
MDDDTVLAAAHNNPTGLMRAFHRTTIDEVPRVPDLSRAIKKSVDEDRRAWPVPVDGLSHYILGSDDGLERYVSCRRNPRPENRNGLRIQLVEILRREGQNHVEPVLSRSQAIAVTDDQSSYQPGTQKRGRGCAQFVGPHSKESRGSRAQARRPRSQSSVGFEPPARTPHAFRHTFAMNYLKRGGSVLVFLRSSALAARRASRGNCTLDALKRLRYQGSVAKRVRGRRGFEPPTPWSRSSSGGLTC